MDNETTTKNLEDKEIKFTDDIEVEHLIADINESFKSKCLQ